VSGVVVLAIGVPLASLVRDTPEKVGQLPDGYHKSGQHQTRQTVGGSDYSARAAMTTLAYWGLAVAIGLRISASAGVMVHIVPIMVWKGMSESMGGIIIATMSFSAIATRLGMGWWGDHWEKNKLVALAMITGAASLVFLALSPGRIWLMLLFAVTFSITEGAAGLTWAMIGDYFGRTSFATLRGVTSTVVSVGALAMPVIAGRVFDVTESYYWVLIPSAGLYVIATAAFLVMRGPDDGQ
jgi:MFS family permease